MLLELHRKRIQEARVEATRVWSQALTSLKQLFFEAVEMSKVSHACCRLLLKLHCD